jgi:ubiquinone/menaquinone biosynthesis C-methylase UbiE
MDLWYRKLRPTLHQASFYTVPTYYLDVNLYVLDFNVAFELVFREVAGLLRGKHVDEFIRKLRNKDDVTRHGAEFTLRHKDTGRFPFVDMEPIVYDSVRFGRVTFTKVASQLHDTDGRLQGWAVALMVKELADWAGFEDALGKRLYLDKLWSVYAGPYDRILTTFAPYQNLIADVVAVVPGSGQCVGDLGAGTGNVTAALLAGGHRVYAVESNIGMLDRFAVKPRPAGTVSVVKGSVESLDCFNAGIFDAVVMVNVLYAVDEPLKCLREIHRLLRPGGVLGFSTTHSDTKLDALLAAITAHVRAAPKELAGQLYADLNVLTGVNREIEHTIARRHSRDDYRRWVEQAGFTITRQEGSTYHGAVMLVHAKKAG